MNAAQRKWNDGPKPARTNANQRANAKAKLRFIDRESLLTIDDINATRVELRRAFYERQARCSIARAA